MEQPKSSTTASPPETSTNHDSKPISFLSPNYAPFSESIQTYYKYHLLHKMDHDSEPPKSDSPSQSSSNDPQTIDQDIAALLDHYQHHVVTQPNYLKVAQLYSLHSKYRSEKKIKQNFDKAMKMKCKSARKEFLKAKWRCSGRTINSGERRLRRMRRAANWGDAKAQIWLCKYLDDEHWEARDKRQIDDHSQDKSTDSANKMHQYRKEEFWHWLWHAAWNGEPWAFCRIAWALENGDDAPDYILKIDTEELRERFLFSRAEFEDDTADHDAHSESPLDDEQIAPPPQPIEADALQEANTDSEESASSTSTTHNGSVSEDANSQSSSDRVGSTASQLAYRLRRAVILYELASSLNYTRGHYLLARCLKNLIGISKLDQYNSNQVLHRALDLLHLAAENSYPPAMNDLACLVIEADPKRAFELFKRASDLGLRAASFNTGACLLNGIGTEVNLGKALSHFDWYHWKEGQVSDEVLKKRVLLTEEELELVAAEALHQVGLRYFNGNQVELDKERAVVYFEKSALKGNMNSQYKLALCYANGEGIEKDPEKACYWYRKSAENGHRESLNNLGVCLRSGIGCEKNEEEAARCYHLAAQKKNRIAAANLASCYENGIGVERDEHQAFYWYERSAEQGYPKGLCALASYYENGRGGCSQNIKKAKQLYLRAGELGYVKAYHCLGVLFNKLNSLQESIQFFQKAAKQGHPASQFRLGLFYEFGRGGAEQNEEKARHWYEAAAKGGNPEARKKLLEGLSQQEQE